MNGMRVVVKKRRLEKIARWLGVLSSTGFLIVYLVVIYYRQFGPGGMDGMFAVGPWKMNAGDIQMIAVSLAGMLTSLFKRPLLMILVFAISFYPVGLYLLGVPGWARIGGFFDLVFLLATVLMVTAKYKIENR